MSNQFDLIVLGSGSGARDGANKARMEYDRQVRENGVLGLRSRS